MPQQAAPVWYQSIARLADFKVGGGVMILT